MALDGLGQRNLVVTQNHNLFDAFFVALIAFDVLQSVLFFLDVAGIAVIGIVR